MFNEQFPRYCSPSFGQGDCCTRLMVLHDWPTPSFKIGVMIQYRLHREMAVELFTRKILRFKSWRNRRESQIKGKSDKVLSLCCSTRIGVELSSSKTSNLWRKICEYPFKHILTNNLVKLCAAFGCKYLPLSVGDIYTIAHNKSTNQQQPFISKTNSSSFVLHLCVWSASLLLRLGGRSVGWH